MKNKPSLPSLARTLLLAAGAFASGAGLTQAADGTWTSQANGSWSDVNNWQGGAIAGGAGSTAYFNAVDVLTNATPLTVTADYSDPVNFYSITNANIYFGDTSTNDGATSWVIADAGTPFTLDSLTTSNSIVDVDLARGATNNLAAGWGTATIQANIDGTNTLVKTGPNRLILAPSSANSFLGGIVIMDGMVQLGPVLTPTSSSTVANANAPGTGPVIFKGTTGSLRLQNAAIPGDNGGSNPTQNTFSNPVHVDAGDMGTIFLSPRAFPAFNSVVTGGGTLRIFTDFVRANLNGDFSGFTGTLNIASSTRGTGNDLRWNFADPLTLANVTVNITSNGFNGNTVFGYSQMPAGTTLVIGALGADPAIATLTAGAGSGAGAQNQINYQVGGLNTSATYGGIFSGTVGLIKEGSGTWILAGNNTQNGRFVINSGVVQIGNGGTTGAVGAPTVVVTNESVLRFARGGSLTVSNMIVGAGSVEVANAADGTVLLLGANQFTGGLVLKSGILAAASEAPLGSDPGAFTPNLLTFDGGALRNTNSFAIDDPNRGITLAAGGGVLSPDAGTTLTVANAIVGSGDLTVNGAGTVTLTGANTYNGRTVLQSGTLALSSEAPLGAAPGGLVADQLTFDGGTLAATASFAIDDANRGISISSGGGEISVGAGNTLTISEPMTGSGTLAKVGAGTLLINGSSTRSGNTVVSAGTLSVSASGSLAGSPLVEVSGGAVLDVTAAGLTIGSGQTLGGNGTVSGNVTVPAGGTVTAGASVGVLTINGNLTLNGGTNLVEISNTTNDLLNVQGNLALSGPSTVSLSLLTGLPVGTYPLIKYSGTLSGSVANLAIAGYPASRLTASLVHNAGAKTIDLVISGSAVALVWQGGLNGNAWDVNGTANWLNGLNPDVFFNGDAVLFDNNGAANPNVNLTQNVSPSVATVNSSTDYTFSGSGKVTGLSTLVKQGANTLTVLTANDNSGGMTISAGTVQVGNGTTGGSIGTGDIVDNGALAFNVPGSSTVPGQITGSGSVAVQGGTVVLTGNNAYGATTVGSGAVLQVGDGGDSGSVGTGGVSLSGSLVYDRTGIVTNNGAISGSGNLTVQGGGTVVLPANNSYAGETLVTASTLQVGTGGTSGSLGTAGTVTVTNGGSLVFNRSDAITNATVIVGANGTVAQAGSGTVVLNTDNSYGATLITNGKLQVGDGANASGTLGTGVVTVTSPGTLVFNRPGSNTFTNTVAGSGNVVYLGQTNLSLNSVSSSYSGTTTVSNSTVTLVSSGNTDVATTAVNQNAFGTSQISVLGSSSVEMAGNRVINGDVGGNGAGNFANAVNIPAGQDFTLWIPGRATVSSAVTGSGTFNLGIQYVRGDINANWTGFSGLVNVVTNFTTNMPTFVYDFRMNSAAGIPNARLFLNENITMYSRATANSYIPIGELAGGELTSVRAASGGGGSPGFNQNWVIGGLNTDATFGGTLLDGNSFIKAGTGRWTLTAANSYTGSTIVSNGVLALAQNSQGADGDISSSSTIAVVAPGVLDVTGRTDGTLYVNTLLEGNGTVMGDVYIGGTIAPGLSTNVFGNLTVTSGLVVDGTVNFKVDHVSTAVSDKITAATITINGGINVLQQSTNDLQTGDTFALFSGAVAGPGTNQITLPDMNPNTGTAYVWTNRLHINGTVQLLQGGVPTIPTTPTNIVSTVSGNTLTLTWPASHTGWRLQSQTNSLNVGLSSNWVDVPDSTTTNRVDLPIGRANGAVFFRLIHNVTP